MWREFSKPITERSEAKPMQSRITFDTQLKIALILVMLTYLDLKYLIRFDLDGTIFLFHKMIMRHLRL